MDRLRAGSFRLGALCLAALAAGAQTPVEGTRLVAYELALAAPDPGTPASAALEWVGDARGIVFVHVLSTDFDPAIAAWRTSDRQLIDSDEDDGGGTRPFLELQYAPGIQCEYVVTAQDGARSGSARVLIGLAPDSPEVLAAEAEWRRRLREARARAVAGDLEQAREQVLAVTAEVDSTPGADASTIVERVRAEAVFLLRDMDSSADAVPVARKLVTFRERYMPAGHQRILAMQHLLATLLRLSEQHPEALEILSRAVETYSDVLDPAAPQVLLAKLDLAAILIGFQRHEEALALQLEAVAILDAPGRPLDPLATYALSSAAASYGNLGDPARAAEILERVVAAQAGLVDETNAQHIGALRSLATARQELEDLAEARFLFERVLELQERVFVDEGLQSIKTRVELAALELSMRESASARTRLEAVMASLESKLDEDAPLRRRARDLLSRVWIAEGELERAESILRNRRDCILELDERAEDELLFIERGLAGIAMRRGRYAEALAHLEGARALSARAPGSRDASLARLDCSRGEALLRLGRASEARASLEHALALSASVTDSTSGLVLRSRALLASALRELGEGSRLRDELRRLSAGLREAAFSYALRLSTRETQLLLEGEHAFAMSTLLSLLDAVPPEHRGDLVASAFAAVESTRSAATVAFRALRLLDNGVDGEGTRLRRALQLASERVAAAPQPSDAASAARLQAVLQEHAAAERALRNHHYQRLEGLGALPRIDPATLAEGLPEDAAFIGYRVFTDSPIGEVRRAAGEARHLGAFVLLRGRAPSFIDLGPLEPIESAVAAWRETVAARKDDLAPGSALTSLVIQPLLPLLANTRCWWIAADHALHFVPLDALPIDGERVGDRRRVVAVPSLVRWSRAGRRDDASAGGLLAIGGLEYGDSPVSVDAAGAPEETRHGARFDPLANTRLEASEVVDLFTMARAPGSPSLLLEGEEATRDVFFEEAPASRFLHLATHGYFEPGAGLQSGADHAAWVELDSLELQGVAPMTLCGIALAGANAGRGVDGHFTGIVTAQELASLDLSRCELAVLSACETHLGVVRRGVGVESLQKALHAAGVRSSVTSLWRVSDDATRELMGGFYRALWVEGRPAAEALWRAKQALRLRRAPVADWAGWVLSESP